MKRSLVTSRVGWGAWGSRAAGKARAVVQTGQDWGAPTLQWRQDWSTAFVPAKGFRGLFRAPKGKGPLRRAADPSPFGARALAQASLPLRAPTGVTALTGAKGGGTDGAGRHPLLVGAQAQAQVRARAEASRGTRGEAPEARPAPGLEAALSAFRGADAPPLDALEPFGTSEGLGAFPKGGFGPGGSDGPEGPEGQGARRPGPVFVPWLQGGRGRLGRAPWPRVPRRVPKAVVFPPLGEGFDREALDRRAFKARRGEPAWKTKARARDAFFAALRHARAQDVAPRPASGGRASDLQVVLADALAWRSRPFEAPRARERKGPEGPDGVERDPSLARPLAGQGLRACWQRAAAWCASLDTASLVALHRARRRGRWTAPDAFQSPWFPQGALGPLRTRLGPLRARLGSLRTRPGSLRTRLGSLRTRPGPSGRPLRAGDVGGGWVRGGWVPLTFEEVRRRRRVHRALGRHRRAIRRALLAILPWRTRLRYTRLWGLAPAWNTPRARRARGLGSLRTRSGSLRAHLGSRRPRKGPPRRGPRRGSLGVRGWGQARTAGPHGIRLRGGWTSRDGSLRARGREGLSALPWRPLTEEATKRPQRATKDRTRPHRRLRIRGRCPVRHPAPRMPLEVEGALRDARALPGADRDGPVVRWRTHRRLPRPMAPLWMQVNEGARRACLPSPAALAYAEDVMAALRPHEAAIVAHTAWRGLHARRLPRAHPGPHASALGRPAPLAPRWEGFYGASGRRHDAWTSPQGVLGLEAGTPLAVVGPPRHLGVRPLEASRGAVGWCQTLSPRDGWMDAAGGSEGPPWPDRRGPRGLKDACKEVRLALRVHGLGAVALRRRLRAKEDPTAAQRRRTWPLRRQGAWIRGERRWLPLRAGFGLPLGYGGRYAPSNASFHPPRPLQGLQAEGPEGEGLHAAWALLRAYTPEPRGRPAWDGLEGPAPEEAATPWAAPKGGWGPLGPWSTRRPLPWARARATWPQTPPLPPQGNDLDGTGREGPDGSLEARDGSLRARLKEGAGGRAFPSPWAQDGDAPRRTPWGRGPEAGASPSAAGSQGPLGPAQGAQGPLGDAFRAKVARSARPSREGMRWHALAGPMAPRARGWELPSEVQAEERAVVRAMLALPAPPVPGTAPRPGPTPAWDRLQEVGAVDVWRRRFQVTDPWNAFPPAPIRGALEAAQGQWAAWGRTPRYVRRHTPRLLQRRLALGFGARQRPFWFRTRRRGTMSPPKTGYAFRGGTADPRGGVRPLAPGNPFPPSPPAALGPERVLRDPERAPRDPRGPKDAVPGLSRPGFTLVPTVVQRWGVPEARVGMGDARMAAFAVPRGGGVLAAGASPRFGGAVRRAPGRPLEGVGWVPGHNPYTVHNRTLDPKVLATWDMGPSHAVLVRLREALGRWRGLRGAVGPGGPGGPRRQGLDLRRATSGPSGPSGPGVWAERALGVGVVDQPSALLLGRPLGAETPLGALTGLYAPGARHAALEGVPTGGILEAPSVPRGPRGVHRGGVYGGLDASQVPRAVIQAEGYALSREMRWTYGALEEPYAFGRTAQVAPDAPRDPWGPSGPRALAGPKGALAGPKGALAGPKGSLESPKGALAGLQGASKAPSVGDGGLRGGLDPRRGLGKAWARPEARASEGPWGWRPSSEVRRALGASFRRRARRAPRKKSKYTASEASPAPASAWGQGAEGLEGPDGAEGEALYEEAWTVFSALPRGWGPSGSQGGRGGVPEGRGGWGAYVEEAHALHARRRGWAMRVESAQRAGHGPRAWRAAWQPVYARMPWEDFLARLRRHWLRWATAGTPSPVGGPGVPGGLGPTARAWRRALWDRLGAVWAFKGGAQARRWVVLHRQGGGLAFLQEVARQVRAWERVAARQADARRRVWRAQRRAWRAGMVGVGVLHRLLTAKVHWRRWSHAHRLRRHAIRLRDHARARRRARARRVGLAAEGPLRVLRGPERVLRDPERVLRSLRTRPEDPRTQGGLGLASRPVRGSALVPLSPVLSGGMAAQDGTWEAWQSLVGDPTDGAWRTARPRRREGRAKTWTFFRGPEPTHAWGQDGTRLPLWAEVTPWDPTGARNAEVRRVVGPSRPAPPATLRGPRGSLRDAGPRPRGVSPWAFFTPDGRGRTQANDALPRALGPFLGPGPSRLGGQAPQGDRGAQGPRRGEDLTPRRFRVPQAVVQDPRLRRALAVLGLGDRNWGVVLRRWRYRRAMKAIPGDPYAWDRLKWPLDDEALPVDGGEWSI